jgi:hypothetical protein
VTKNKMRMLVRTVMCRCYVPALAFVPTSALIFRRPRRAFAPTPAFRPALPRRFFPFFADDFFAITLSVT